MDCWKGYLGGNRLLNRRKNLECECTWVRPSAYTVCLSVSLLSTKQCVCLSFPCKHSEVYEAPFEFVCVFECVCVWVCVSACVWLCVSVCVCVCPSVVQWDNCVCTRLARALSRCPSYRLGDMADKKGWVPPPTHLQPPTSPYNSSTYLPPPHRIWITQSRGKRCSVWHKWGDPKYFTVTCLHRSNLNLNHCHILHLDLIWNWYCFFFFLFFFCSFTTWMLQQ